MGERARAEFDNWFFYLQGYPLFSPSYVYVPMAFELDPVYEPENVNSIQESPAEMA